MVNIDDKISMALSDVVIQDDFRIQFGLLVLLKSVV